MFEVSTFYLSFVLVFLRSALEKDGFLGIVASFSLRAFEVISAVVCLLKILH